MQAIKVLKHSPLDSNLYPLTSYGQEWVLHPLMPKFSSPKLNLIELSFATTHSPRSLFSGFGSGLGSGFDDSLSVLSLRSTITILPRLSKNVALDPLTLTFAALSKASRYSGSLSIWHAF